MTVDCQQCGRAFDPFANHGTCPGCDTDLEVQPRA